MLFSHLRAARARLAGLIAVVVVVATFLVGVGPASAATTVLRVTASDTNSLIETLVDANVESFWLGNDVVVFVPAGRYVLDCRSGPLLIVASSNYTVFGLNGRARIEQQCDGQRVVTIVGSAGQVSLANFEITGGDTQEDGAGIRVQETAAGDSLRFHLISSLVTNNITTGSGGGIASAAPVTVTDSRIFLNSANLFGGGVLASDELRLVRSEVSGNGSFAGTIFALESLTVENSTISTNSAVAWASAIIANSSVYLRYSTIANNVGPDLPAVDSIGRVTVHASVVASSEPMACSFRGGSASRFGMATDASCGFGRVGNPRLGALAFNGGTTRNHLPAAGSPLLDVIPTGDELCVNAGVDQRGLSRPRPAGGRCDIGAVER